MSFEVIITCEHGGNEIPQPYLEYFSDAQSVLNTHRGWDPGTLPLARDIADFLNAPLYFSTTSRLLVDLNRSPGHPRQFSEYSRRMSQSERERVIVEYYTPYRTDVSEAIEAGLRRGKTILHVSVHSFTPSFAGKARTTDVGLLYDPRRETESRFVALWRRALAQHSTHELTIHRNRPYRGTSDGFTTSLRKVYPNERYLGIELELSHKWLSPKLRFPKWLRDRVVESLIAAIHLW